MSYFNLQSLREVYFVAKFSKKLNITLLLFVILSTILIAMSCGSSDNSFISTNPNIINTPSTFINTPTPALTSVPVSAYLYVSNTSLEDGENIANTIVSDIPLINPDLSGSTPLLTQISKLQQENPDDWNSPEIKELSDKLFAILNQSQALPETAKVFSKYQDALNESPIPVNNEGYISGQAVVGDTDTNVQLEVSLDDDHYIDAETIIPSNNLTSSDATGATLKSCPEKVFVLPGEVIIIQISSTTGINLKESGLTFSLKNPNLGCITSKPIFLEICGKKKYEKAYCLFYAKKNLTTPIDSIITAKTVNGLQLEIFTEIIKSCASISGKVFTGGKPLIKGYVKSIGSKAFCKLDSSGSYTLPRVFCGHSRKIVATYWIQDNDKKIRHREEKIIDFFNNNLSNFNFGEEHTPTPTSTPSSTPTPRDFNDIYYDLRVSELLYQYNQWKKELKPEEATQKTVDWLNGEFGESTIPDGIKKAGIDSFDNTAMWVMFSDGHSVHIAGEEDDWKIYPNASSTNKISNGLEKINKNVVMRNKEIAKKIASLPNSLQKAQTVNSNKILILAPFAWEEEMGMNIYDKTVYNEITTYLKGLKNNDGSYVYDITSVITRNNEIEYSETFHDPNIPPPEVLDPKHPDPNDPIYTLTKRLTLNILPERNYVLPGDFLNLSQYGIIYIATHGTPTSLSCGPVFDNIPETQSLNAKEYSEIDPNKLDGTWFYSYREIKDPDNPEQIIRIKLIALSNNFLSQQQPIKNSIVYLDACKSAVDNGLKGYSPFNTAYVYLGHHKSCYVPWARRLAYKFFCYMMFGIDHIPESNSDSPDAIPLSVRNSYNKFTSPPLLLGDSNRLNPDPGYYPIDPNWPINPFDHRNAYNYYDCRLLIYTANGKYDDTYFPAPVIVTVQKK